MKHIIKFLKTVILTTLSFCLIFPIVSTVITIKAEADESKVYMRYPNGKAKTFTMAFDDGLVKDESLMFAFSR